MRLDAARRQRICQADQRFRPPPACRWSTAFSTCRRWRPAISRSRRSRSRRRQVIGNCCDLLALQGARGGHRPRRAAAGRPAGDRRRQARVQADPAQPAVQRDQVHRSRRPRDGERACRRAPALLLDGRGHRRRHQRGRSAARRRSVLPGARAAYDRRHDGTGLGLSIVQGPGGAARRRGRNPQPARRGHARHRAPAARLRDGRVRPPKHSKIERSIRRSTAWPTPCRISRSRKRA